MNARTEILNQARDQASLKVAEARKGIERDMEVAKAGLQGEVERLATEVIATVLRPVAMAGGAR
jgi:F0F1-type ATP synthase membrane subunit b/b'